MAETAVRMIQGRARLAARAVAEVAVKGLPALRAALHGARLGAGRAFAPAVIERLGVAVLPATARVVGEAIARTTGPAGFVLRRGGSMVRAGARELVLHAREGLTLRVSPTGGAVATATEDAVRAMARTTVRGAAMGIGRAALSGAAAGAVLDGAIAGVGAAVAVRRGQMTPRAAARQVGMHAARGAVSGAVGVAAAGAVSAGIAATGFTLIGAPVAIPIVTMVAAGAYAAKWFDRLAGRVPAADATVAVQATPANEVQGA